MPINFETPEDPTEPRLTLAQLRAALVGPKFSRMPDTKRLYRWLALDLPMPSKTLPGTGKAGRATRRFLLSHVLAWLENPEAYYCRKRRAS